MFPSWNARAMGLIISAEESIRIAAEAGFPGVDLMVRDLVQAGTDVRELRSRMDDLGVRGGAWPLPVHWRGDSERYREELQSLPAYAEAAAILGLTRTGTWVLSECVGPPAEVAGGPDDPFAYTLDHHVDRLGRIAEILRYQGCRLGLEIMGPKTARSGLQRPFVRNYKELEVVLSGLRCQHDNVGILADAFHLFAAGESVQDVRSRCGSPIVWVHVADAMHTNRETLEDWQRELPGHTGCGESKALLKLLQEDGYDGPVTAEPLGLPAPLQSEPPASIARRTLEALNSLWSTDGPAGSLTLSRNQTATSLEE